MRDRTRAAGKAQGVHSRRHAQPVQHSVCGVRGIQELEGVHFDLLLLGVTSYSPETGFACGVEEEALLKQTVLHRVEHVAVLLDSSKIDRRSTFRICGLDEVDTVISDGRLRRNSFRRARMRA